MWFEARCAPLYLSTNQSKDLLTRRKKTALVTLILSVRQICPIDLHSGLTSLFFPTVVGKKIDVRTNSWNKEEGFFSHRAKLPVTSQTSFATVLA